MLNEILQLSQKTGGNAAEYILPANSTKELIQQTNSSYADMCRVADSTLTYLESMLKNSEYFLTHDREAEQRENQMAEEKRREIELKKQKEREEKERNDERMAQLRKEAMEKFYANQENLANIPLNLTAPKKNAALKNKLEEGDDVNKDDDSLIDDAEIAMD